MRIVILITVCFFTVHSTTAQLEASYLESIRKSPKSMTIDIFEQKKDGDTYKTEKHTRYELSLKGQDIITQKVYDTMSTIAYNKSLTYVYDNSIDKNLIEIVQNDFNDNLMKRTKYQYDDRGLLVLKEEQFDKDNELLQTITYDFDGCKDASLTADLPTSSSYTCLVQQFSNRASKRSSVEINGGMGLPVKIINYSADGSIANTETFQYNESWKLVKQSKKTSSGRGYTTVYTYNEQGDIASKKAGYVEFYYTYEYDENENWTQMIETSKVKTRRYIYKRTFVY